MKFCALFLLILTVASCGIKSQSKPLEPETESSSASFLSYPTCPDELRIADIPAGWREVTARELITGKKAHFEVVKASGLLLTGLDGRPITVSTETTFADGEATENKVLCQNLTDGEYLKFNIEVAVHISQKNGYLYRADRREAQLAKLSFDLKDGVESRASVQVERIERPGERGLSSQHPLTFMESSEKIVKFYVLPDGSLEVRKGEVIRMNGLHAEFFTAIRYRVVD
jgi:hypothetical protein